MSTTLKLLQQARLLRASPPNAGGECASDGLYPAPCYTSDGVLSYTCSPSGYKSRKAACESCNPMGSKCPTNNKIKNLSLSCDGIGGEKCTNNAPIDNGEPIDDGEPIDNGEPIDDGEPIDNEEANTLTKNWTVEQKEKVKREVANKLIICVKLLSN